MKRLFFVLLQLHCGLWALSFAFELGSTGKSVIAQDNQNETNTENVEVTALLDYESGLVFYKDSSISACLVERIPDRIFEVPGVSSPPEFKIPIPSEDICIGGDNKILKTESVLISEPGLLFCNGLPILDIGKIVKLNEKPSDNQNQHGKRVRRKRQSNANGYYRTSAPIGDARAQSNWKPGQGSQAQVQGQVFGQGVFSGQAQSQSTGVSQSQVQLSGVGVRGQISSSSGNAQAQLSLHDGAGSGQASGLGEGPSNSQVQVSLGQQGQESMASASATSGGARARIGGAPGIGSVGNYMNGQFTGARQNGQGVTNGGPVPEYGYVPGTRYFDDTIPPVATRTHGSGLGSRDRQFGAQTPSHINGHSGYYGQAELPGLNGQYRGNQGLSGTKETPSSSGIGDTRFPSNGARVRNGGGIYGIEDHGLGSARGTGTVPTANQLLGSGTTVPGTTAGGSIPGNAYEQGSGISGGNGNRLSIQQGSGAHGQSVTSPDATGSYGQDYSIGARVPSQSRVGATDGSGRLATNSFGSSQMQPGQVGSRGSYQDGGGVSENGARGTQGGFGQSDIHRTPTRIVDRNIPVGSGIGTLPGGNGGVVDRVPESNAGAYHAGRRYAESSTPGAYAATYGLGQAQAQTVYFGNAGNGQYIPIRYDRSSAPGGSPGIHRFQDQQVGVGNAGQRQQLSHNGLGTGVGSSGSTFETPSGSHQHTGLRNGYSSYGYEHGGRPSTTIGQQPVRIGEGILPSNGIQSKPGVSTGLGSHATGSTGGDSGHRPRLDRTPASGPSFGVSDGQPSIGFTDGFGRTQEVQTPPPGFLHAPNGYQHSHRETHPTNRGNGQTHVTNGFSNGHYGQHQTPPSGTNNGQTHITNGYSNGHYGQHQTPPSGTNNGQTHITNGYSNGHYSQHQTPSAIKNGQAPVKINGNVQAPVQRPGQGHTYTPGGYESTPTGDIGQDGFSPSYGITRPSQDDPDGRKCTIITFSCTIVVESNGRAKICKPSTVRMNGNGNGSAGGNGAAGSKICCC